MTRKELRKRRKEGIERVNYFLKMYKAFRIRLTQIVFLEKHTSWFRIPPPTEEEQILRVFLSTFTPKEKEFYRLVRNPDVYQKLQNWYEKRNT